MISKTARKKALKQAAIEQQRKAKLAEKQAEQAKLNAAEKSVKVDKYGVAKEEFSFLSVNNKWIVVVGGVLLVGASLLDMLRDSRAQEISPLMLQRQMLAERLSRGETIYTNPKMSLFERLFCRGAETSKYCPEKPLHPFLESSGGIDKRWEYLKAQKEASQGVPTELSTTIILK